MNRSLENLYNNNLNNSYEENGLRCSLSRYLGGLHWEMINMKGETLSIILHSCSYGKENGRFETRCSWHDDVEGFLNFGQVQQKIHELKSRDLKAI